MLVKSTIVGKDERKDYDAKCGTDEEFSDEMFAYMTCCSIPPRIG
jgi:hypothetical protein